MSAQRIVIVGAGYAGTLATIRIARRAGRRATVTLVNPEDFLVQRLRLHQLAAGHQVAEPPLRRLLGRRGATLEQGWASAIDLDSGRVSVIGADGPRELPFDRLVLATGSRVDRLAVPGAAEHAYALGDRAAAIELRRALAALPEGAEVAVGGGGFTGLEAASEIADARPDLRVRLVTAGALGEWLSPRGRDYLAAALARLGVDVVAHARVRAVEPTGLALDDGATIPCDLAVWCGGFAPSSLGRDAGLAVDERGCVLVDAALRSCSHPHVLAVGDAMAPPPLPNGARFRMTCQAGMPSGAHAADTLFAELRGHAPAPFDFGYFHMPISLGRRDGLIQFVERDDTPKASLLTGRTAAVYKDIVSGGAITGMKLERRLPGGSRWLSSGAPAGELHQVFA
jgi:NADH:ubiquinone reductase (H+-translocating)